MQVKLAIGIWAYLKPLVPLADVLARLQDLGFDGVEVPGAAPYAPVETLTTPEACRAWRQEFADHDMEIACLGARKLGDPVGRDTDEYLDDVRRHLEICKSVDLPWMRISSCGRLKVLDEFPYKEARARALERVRAAAALAQQQGITLLWEFEPNLLLNSPREVVEFVDDVGSDHFKVMFDTAHAHLSAVVGANHLNSGQTLPGGVPEFARLLGKRIGRFHLADTDGTLDQNGTSTRVGVGDGILDFESIVEALYDSGYSDPWWTLDLCNNPQAWQITESSKRNVDRILRHVA